MLTERQEQIRNAERYAARRYRAKAQQQQQRLERAYNAAPESTVERVTCETSYPVIDDVRRLTSLYGAQLTQRTLGELDHATQQIVILGAKSIVCVGAFLVFLAMIGV